MAKRGRTGAPHAGTGPRNSRARRARGASPSAARGARRPAGVARAPARRTRPEPAARGAAFERVHRLVRRIPRGRVMNYGQIARHLGGPLSARAVGWAMHGCPDDVPWHRVVNAAGGCSSDAVGEPGLQRRLLEGEGVAFRPNGTVDLARYRWTPRGRAAD